MSHAYDHRSIEARWRAYWPEKGTFRTPNPGDSGFDPEKPKCFVLDMFPYTSGKGLHVGHPLGYIASDIVARHKRMLGYRVLHPMGYDAFGLPAEQYAVETGAHPRRTTEASIDRIREQFRALGLSIDWSRELATIHPSYYKWTQWIFLQLYGSWVDPETGQARPVETLEQALETGARRVSSDLRAISPGDPGFAEARAWSAIDAPTRRRVLDNHRLAYLAEVPVNWCPALGTVLANEEVSADGRSERGNHPVYKRPLEQWMLRITAYADRLVDDLARLDWPESVKRLQENWVGRSDGARVRFPVPAADETIEIFTTRPDTLFGATYMVLAPEHPLVDAVTTAPNAGAVADYRREAARKTDLDRQTEGKAKTGVPTGGVATNPVTGEEIPIWIADYVLMGYGTGAIMAVPAHDQRDFAFARAHDLPLRVVVTPPDEWLEAAGGDEGGVAAERRARYTADPTRFAEAFGGDGVACGSHQDAPVRPGAERLSIDGKPSDEAKRAIIAWLESTGIGRGERQYKLRDWLFSRQRYWGEPFPVLHGPDGEIVPVDESELPVELPELTDFSPRAVDDPDAPPQPALARADDDWRYVTRDGVRYERELNTMPQWAGSCWYYLRYIDPQNEGVMVGADAERAWMEPNGVDLYIGGVEQAVLHLLYARFWHKVLHDLGHVSTAEPFHRLVNQGYIQAYAYQDARGFYVEADRVEEPSPGIFTFEGRPVTRTTLGKMGKSLKNSVTPDEIIDTYGCDTLRLYEMYMGPLDQSKPWNPHAIVGVRRFLQRLWRNLVDEESGALRLSDAPPSEELKRLLHKTIDVVSRDIADLRFNTAIARLIELNNALVALDRVPREVAEPLVLMLSPIAPHIGEELWSRLGHDDSIAYVAWPVTDERYLVADEVELVVQVMGKKRAMIRVPADAGEDDVREVALADPGVAKYVEGKTVRKVIHVPGRLVNIVAS